MLAQDRRCLDALALDDDDRGAEVVADHSHEYLAFDHRAPFKLVLPDGFEPSASRVPSGCTTVVLRQQIGGAAGTRIPHLAVPTG